MLEEMFGWITCLLLGDVLWWGSNFVLLCLNFLLIYLQAVGWKLGHGITWKEDE